MYVNGLGFRAIERLKKVHHTTIITWVKRTGKTITDAPLDEEIPVSEACPKDIVTQIDELETFVGSKKTKYGCGR